MDIKVLFKKPTLTSDNNEEYTDLSYNSLTDAGFNSILGVERITSNEEMRLDKTALKYYKSTESLDILYKANNIFNPFAIMEGDIILVPSIPKDDIIYKNKGEVVKKDIRQNFVDTARLSTKDQNRINRLKEKSSKLSNGSSTPLPPNMLKEGETNKTYKNGGIRLGE